MNTQWLAHYQRWMAIAVVDTLDDTVAKCRQRNLTILWAI